MLPKVILLLVLLSLPARAALETFYLGTYSRKTASAGIYVGTLDSRTGRLGPLQKAAFEKDDPTFLALSPGHRFLFAALSDGVESFRIRADGTLAAINRQPAGANTCHVSLDITGRELFSASYDAGSIAAFPVGADGRIGAATATITLHGSGPNAARQQGPHAHSVYVDPENRFLYACDLGSDRIWIFHIGAKGKLEPADPPAAAVMPGSGPRHLAFSADGRRVYVANELGVCVSVFSRNASTGELTLLDTIANIKPGWPTGTGSGEISLDSSGRRLYVSTRLEDRMTVFQLGRDDSVRREQIVASPVKFPRSFALDPTGRWIMIAGETDNRISVMRIDAATGRLKPTREFAPVDSPVCVLFMPSAAPSR